MAKQKKRSFSIIECKDKKDFEKAWKRLDKEKVDLLDLYDSFKDQGVKTKEAIYRFIHEKLFIDYGIKMTAKQVQNRVTYLQKKAQTGLDKELTRKPNRLKEVKTQIFPPKKKPLLIQDTVPSIDVSILPFSVFSEHLVDRREQRLILNEWVYQMLDGEKFVKAVDKLCQIYNCRHYLHGDNKLTPMRVVDELALFFNVKDITLRTRYYTTRKKMRSEAHQQQVIATCKKKMDEDQDIKIQELEQKLVDMNDNYNKLYDKAQQQLDRAKKYEDRTNELALEIHNIRKKMSIVEFVKNRFYDIITLRFPIIRKYWRRDSWK